MSLFRGQITTKQKIQNLQSIQITNKEEALAFLDFISTGMQQASHIFKRANIQEELRALNQARAVEQVEQPVEEVVTVVPENTQVLEQVDVELAETHTTEQKKKRVKDLKGE